MDEKSTFANSLSPGWDTSLCELLQAKLDFSVEKAESLSYALVDILEAVVQVYGTNIPMILEHKASAETEMLQDMAWDIREAFRHIDYHIHESGVLDL